MSIHDANASIWVKAKYEFHTFSYRDPRCAASSAQGLPVVSPTAVLLGIASTLFQHGKAGDAITFLDNINTCKVIIDSPDGVIFFRAFQQMRRYHSSSKGKTERVGLTNINQATREYSLLEGAITVYVAVGEMLAEAVKFALQNRSHLGTHDSLCSLVDDVEVCTEEPNNVVFLPPERWQSSMPLVAGVTMITLARFKDIIKPTVGRYWWMAGGENTELVQYIIQGRFSGTSRGKVYRKKV